MATLRECYERMPEKLLQTIIGFLVMVLLAITSYFADHMIRQTDKLSTDFAKVIPEIQHIKEKQNDIKQATDKTNHKVIQIIHKQDVMCTGIQFYWNKVKCK